VVIGNNQFLLSDPRLQSLSLIFTCVELSMTNYLVLDTKMCRSILFIKYHPLEEFCAHKFQMTRNSCCTRFESDVVAQSDGFCLTPSSAEPINFVTCNTHVGLNLPWKRISFTAWQFTFSHTAFDAVYNAIMNREFATRSNKPRPTVACTSADPTTLACWRKLITGPNLIKRFLKLTFLVSL
jgi:hypothetical protein